MTKASYKKDKIILASFNRGYSVRNGKVYGPKGKSLGTVNSRGYITIGLLHKKKLYICSAHRVIWIWYNGIPENTDLQINHIDGNKQNNRRWNLELVTPTLNLTHAIKTGLKRKLKAEDNSNSLLSNCQAKEIFIKYHLHKFTQKRLAKKYKVNKFVIGDLVRGKTYSSVTEKLCISKRKGLKAKISDAKILKIQLLRKRLFTSYEISDILGISRNTVMKYWK